MAKRTTGPRAGRRPRSHLDRPESYRPRFGGAAHTRPTGAPQDVRGLFAAMRRYLEHRGVLGATAQALESTERCLRDFIIWADERGVTHPQQVSRAVLERYQRWLYHYRKKNGEPLSVTSQRTKLIPLKSWFKWLTRQGEIDANPAAELDLPRHIRRLPCAVFTPEEAERVLAQADTSKPLGLRDRAIMEMMYACGIRRFELAGLQMGDVDRERGLVLIREGKGRKDRLVPLGQRALHWLQQYLERGRGQLVWDHEDHTLFLSVEGRPMHIDWLSGCMGRYVRRAGLDKRGSCHIWRHTMATLMLEGGADIRFIQAMLGHSDISTTQIYTQVAVGKLQQVHAMTHPAVHLRVRGQDGADSPQNDPQGAQTAQAAPNPHPEPQNAAAALLAALAAEADEEAAGGAGTEGP
jgi:integrase/recombinase XerD